MNKKRSWVLFVIGLLALLVCVNVLVVERNVACRLAAVQLGMTQSEVIEVAGEPHDQTTAHYYSESSGQRIHVGNKTHFGYYFSYVWDYVLLFPLNHARGFRIVFGKNDRVESVETHGYFSRYWYVKK